VFDYGRRAVAPDDAGFRAEGFIEHSLLELISALAFKVCRQCADANWAVDCDDEHGA
jgi:hypothetical protein